MHSVLRFLQKLHQKLLKLICYKFEKFPMISFPTIHLLCAWFALNILTKYKETIHLETLCEVNINSTERQRQLKTHYIFSKLPN